MELGIFLLAISSLIGTTAGSTRGLPFDKKDWEELAQKKLKSTLENISNEGRAKNIIIFLGDGMGLPTVAATRILKGQLKSKPEIPLSFEEFPHVALSKTYSVDRQVSDSASTATAYLCGVKTNFGVIGLDANTEYGKCASAEKRTGSQVDSLLKRAHDAGKLTGVVTTTRITHATPSAAYAHAAARTWESDSYMGNITGGCSDIAQQLIEDNSYIRVLMGGGRRNFMPNTTTDPETQKENTEGGRLDGRNLIEEWIADKKGKKVPHNYVWNKEQFDKVSPKNTDYLLGLFESSHMQYELDRNNSRLGEPSLTEMTEKAIQILSKDDKGFFLLVEGGKIDSAHHDILGKKALYETLTFDAAVEKAVGMLNLTETLIVVTADHSIAFAMIGYSTRDNPILGLADRVEWEGSMDGLPYTSLVYASGKNFLGKREDLNGTDTEANEYLQQVGVPMQYSSHTGEDVAIYAIGPWAHLYQGVYEQNYIPHVMAYAACIGKSAKQYKHCVEETENNGKLYLKSNSSLVTFILLLLLLTI